MNRERKTDLNIVIPQQIWETMDERLILFNDVEQVVAESRISGNRFVNPLDLSYLASSRLNNRRYWVRYTEKEEWIRVISIYSDMTERSKA